MILFALISLSCISAADNAFCEPIAQYNGVDTDEIVAQSDINTEEILTDGENEVSDFSTLNTEIANSTTSTIQLTNNYTYNPEKDTNHTTGIVINKADFTVDGQGFTINGAGLARIFNITANNVTLKNINFINGYCGLAGAIVCENGSLTITDCNFTNNKATGNGGSGGAIGFDADSLTIKNSRFIGNNANNEYGDSGAIIFNGNDLNIIQSEFINNSAQSEGVMLAVADTVTISKSRFENNKAKSGIIAIIALNSFIDECELINNSAEAYVGVSNIEGTMTINNSYFANNTAEKATRLIRNSQGHKAIISNCVFENNIGNEGNYTIDNNYGTIYLYNNTINTQSAEIRNYGGNITSPCTAIALENKTVPIAVGEKAILTAEIVDDNGNLIEDYYYVYFKINDDKIESTYNPETSKYEVPYTFNAPGLVSIDIICPSINITVKQGTCNVRYASYVDLANELNNCQNNTLELTKDYLYNPLNDSSYTNGTLINKTDFTIDGKGHSIDGAGLARIFYITANNLTLININFQNGSSEFAGAIACENGNLTIINCNFTNNKATEDNGYGGAIGFNGISLTIKNSKFTDNAVNNESGESGAIYFNGKILNILQSEFINNSAQSEGVMLAVADTVTISKSRFENNKAKSGIIAISALNSSIDECEFVSNSAEVYVGVSNIMGTMTINNSYFAYNTAEKATRLIRNSQGHKAIISNCVFENNVGNEGNYTIDNNYGIIYLYNNTINTKSAEIHNYGGNITSPCTAIALENKTIVVGVGQERTLTAIIIDDNGNLIEECYYVYFKINADEIESTYNPETSKYEVKYRFNTVGPVQINILCSSITMTVEQGTCDVGEYFADLANEINNCQNNTLELTKSYIYDPVKDSDYVNGIAINKANFTIDGKGHTIDGAGLARIFKITAKNVTLKNINFQNGYCEFGGAIYCEGFDLTFINCNFTNNKASEKGGALYLKESSATVMNTSFTQNNAQTGGTIYIDVSKLNIDNSIFEQNNAFEGGTIYNEEFVSITITNTRFSQNSAKYGGVISNQGGSITITNDEFTDNHADYNGGVIFNTGNIDISDSTFENNNAKYGGAIDHYDQLIKIINTKFTNNTAEEYGGAINNEHGELEITNTNFTQNTARYGGAIENRYYLEIKDCRLENNNAPYGGAIDNDMGEVTIENTQFINNTAARYGGAIYNDNGEMTITNTNFTQNTARYGGAIDNWGKLNIADSNFMQNSAGDYGGAIYNEDGKTTITNTRFANNTANTGGAIETDADMTISDSEFIGNGENCIEVDFGAKLTLNNVTSDVQLVDDTISMEILEAKDVAYGSDVNIKVQVNSSAISKLNIGKVVIKINNVEYSADVKDGIATLVIPNLDAGVYNVNVTYIDNNMTRAEIPVNFTVNKKDITINAENAAYVINYGGTYTVTFKDVDDGTNVTFTLNGKDIGTSTIKNGTASIELTAKMLKTAKAGTQILIIKINGENYSPINKTVNITINKEKTKITAKAKKFKRTAKTKKYKITLKNSKGKAIKKAKVTLKVNGKKYKAKTNSKGKATFKITKLTKKVTYKATIAYKGSSYYNKATKKVKIKIK